MSNILLSNGQRSTPLNLQARQLALDGKFKLCTCTRRWFRGGSNPAQSRSRACAVRSVFPPAPNSKFSAPKPVVFEREFSNSCSFSALVSLQSTETSSMNRTSQLPTALLLLHCQHKLVFMLYDTLTSCRTPLERRRGSSASAVRLSTC